MPCRTGKAKGKASFCEQKVAKKLCWFGPVRFQRHGPIKQKFLRRFFQKAAALLSLFSKVIAGAGQTAKIAFP
jgi:hypothetical protein